MVRLSGGALVVIDLIQGAKGAAPRSKKRSPYECVILSAFFLKGIPSSRKGFTGKRKGVRLLRGPAINSQQLQAILGVTLRQTIPSLLGQNTTSPTAMVNMLAPSCYTKMQQVVLKMARNRALFSPAQN